MFWLFLISLLLLLACGYQLRLNDSSLARGVYSPESRLERIARWAFTPLVVLTLLLAIATLVR